MLVAALALMLFAAFAIAGFSRLPRGHRAIRPWAAARCSSCSAGVVYTALTFNPAYVDRELKLRDSVRQRPHAPCSTSRAGARPARACGPISVPNHKLVADVRWLADAGADGVVARTDPTQTARQRARRRRAVRHRRHALPQAPRLRPVRPDRGLAAHPGAAAGLRAREGRALLQRVRALLREAQRAAGASFASLALAR